MWSNINYDTKGIVVKLNRYTLYDRDCGQWQSIQPHVQNTFLNLKNNAEWSTICAFYCNTFFFLKLPQQGNVLMLNLLRLFACCHNYTINNDRTWRIPLVSSRMRNLEIFPKKRGKQCTSEWGTSYFKHQDDLSNLSADLCLCDASTISCVCISNIYKRAAVV